MGNTDALHLSCGVRRAQGQLVLVIQGSTHGSYKFVVCAVYKAITCFGISLWHVMSRSQIKCQLQPFQGLKNGRRQVALQTVVYQHVFIYFVAWMYST